MRKRISVIIICFLLLALFLLSTYGKHTFVAPTPPPVSSPVAAITYEVQKSDELAPVTPNPLPTLKPLPTPIPGTPSERAKALGLPEPPDIDIRSWEFLYAGISQSLGPFYHPEVKNIEDQLMDSRVVEPTNAFLAATREAGYSVWINAGYRNFEYVSHYFFNDIHKYGSAYNAAQVDYRFPPGTTEHTTGLAIDITDEFDLSANYYDMHDLTVKDTEVYKWMAEHCHEYGFIVRYPEGKEEYYEKPCYPGHFRYVGIESATYIMENDLCFEEFLALYKKY